MHVITSCLRRLIVEDKSTGLCFIDGHLSCVAGASEEPEVSNFTFLSSSSGDTYNYHRIDIPDNGTKLYASIFPVNPVDIYYVYLKYEGFPNDTYYDWVGVIPVPDVDVNDAKRYVFAPPQNYTALNGTYRIGIRLKGSDCRLVELVVSIYCPKLGMFQAIELPP